MFALAASPAFAQTQQDVDNVRNQRDEVRNEATDVAGRIDVLNDSAEDLITQLDLLNVKIAVIDSRLETAIGAAATTREEVDFVEGEIAVLEARQHELSEAMAQSAVEQYMEGAAVDQRSFLNAEDPIDWFVQQSLFQLVARDVTTTQDQLRVVEQQLEDAYAASLALAATAESERDGVARLAAEAIDAHQAQSDLLVQVSERLERRLAEAEALAAIDVQLSDEIRRGEEEIARRLEVARVRAEQREEAERAASGETSAKDRIARPDDIVNVRGIDVHKSVADNLQAMINAAEASGIVLSGAGWRSTEYQIELRIQNCGSTDYLIFDAPAEACYPVTARPASSNHEAGLAIDFMAGGRAIVDTNSTAYLWLAANAATYGFYALWSEPWHWSVDGR
ncbi:MAG: D-alanyl-D-alanine carboxypeptidase family protein [Acidimicrobiales bacterium]